MEGRACVKDVRGGDLTRPCIFYPNDDNRPRALPAQLDPANPEQPTLHVNEKEEAE
jgi:hypothetical protein